MSVAMALFELLQLFLIFLDHPRIEYLWHVPIMPPINQKGIISLAGLPGPLLPGSEDVPAVVIYGGIVLGVAGLVAAVELWLLKNWGFWLTIVVSVLNVLSAAPGVAFAPGALKVFALVGVVVP